MDILFYIIVLIAILYILLIASFSFQWNKIALFHCNDKQTTTDHLKISVLIPFRNEENNLTIIFRNMEVQSFPASQFELILIDDDSTDNSNNIARNLISKSNLSCQLLSSIGGKKQAIKTGLNHANGDLILSLDADVEIGIKHLECFYSFYRHTNAKLIAGPVKFSNDSGILSKLFSLEFSSLIATGAAAIKLGKPIMLNAANMCFERKTALEFQSQIYQTDIASGDDQFLLEAIEKKYGPESIHFLKSSDAIATTLPPHNIKAFIHQRIRWASKTKAYTSIFSKMTAVLVFLFNLLLIGSFIYSFMSLNIVVFLAFYTLKIVIDFPILNASTIFFNQRKLMLYYPLEQFVYPWYVVIIAILSLFGTYEWKGRKLR